MMRPASLWTVAFGLLAACGAGAAVPAARDRVVVIFEECPVQSATAHFGTSYSVWPDAAVEYVDTALVLRRYTPPQAGRDTLVIPAFDGYAELMHLNQAVEENYYLLQAGDTVLFTYGGNRRPRLRSLRSDRLTRWYNLPEEDPRAVQPATGYSTRTTCTNRQYDLMWHGLRNPKYRQDPRYRATLERFARHCPDLDSLCRVLVRYEADYGARLDSLERSGALPAFYAAWLRRRLQPADPARDSLLLASDSAMRYPSCQRLTRRLLPYDFTEEDFRRIAGDTLRSRYARAAAMRYGLYRMSSGLQEFPADRVAACTAVYAAFTGDAACAPAPVVARAMRRDGYSNDLVLEDTAGTRIDWADLLHELRGKVIYVDLWASWCGPCRAGMAAARELRAAYRDRDVAFVYLAVNDRRGEWLAAVAACDTEAYGGRNYLVRNSRESVFLKEIDNRRIPQYLLYDRDGRLVDTDAPRAGDDAVRRQLDALLQ